MRSLLYIVLLLLFSEVNAQTIPDDKRAEWGQANLHFKFTEPQNAVNILDYGGNNDGITDNSQAVELALEQNEGKAAVLFFPAGIYLFNAPVTLKDSIEIKGEGSALTTLLFNFNGQNQNAINISGSSTGNWVLIDGGFDKNSSKIFTDSAFIFAKGDVVEILENNGDWDVVPISWAEKSVGQITVIDSVSEDTLFLQSPLRIDYDTLLHPSIQKVVPVVNAGVRCVKIKRLDEPPNGGSYNVNFMYARNCILSGIESDSSVGSHVYISKSLSVKVDGSYFHHAFQYDGAATHGYGVTLAHHSSECIIDNNIFSHLRHAMMVKTGANGNVIAYNYSRDPFRSEPIHDLSGDISLHGHYAYANLFESNIVQNIMIDHYWGPSGPYNTLFRNRAELWGIIMTSSDLLETSGQNFVGNETTDFSMFYGQYVLTGNNHFQYGNNILGVTRPAGTTDLSDSSYYLNTKPVFWDVNTPWPSVGYPNTLNQGTIPARQRFDDGLSLTVCSDSVYTSIQHSRPKPPGLVIAPNPNRGNFSIITNGDISGNLLIIIVNIYGIIVYKSSFSAGEQNIFPVSVNLPKGIYWVVFRNHNVVMVKKLMVYE